MRTRRGGEKIGGTLRKRDVKKLSCSKAEERQEVVKKGAEDNGEERTHQEEPREEGQKP